MAMRWDSIRSRPEMFTRRPMGEVDVPSSSWVARWAAARTGADRETTLAPPLMEGAALVRAAR